MHTLYIQSSIHSSIHPFVFKFIVWFCFVGILSIRPHGSCLLSIYNWWEDNNNVTNTDVNELYFRGSGCPLPIQVKNPASQMSVANANGVKPIPVGQMIVAIVTMHNCNINIVDIVASATGILN